MPVRLIFAAALAAFGWSAAFAAPAVADDDLQRLTRLDRHVWVLAQPGFIVQPAGNVTIIEQGDGIVLVDAGGSPGAARRVVAQVRALSRKPVKAVVITHWHGDHPQGLDEILKAWPSARTIATAATRAHLSASRTMNTPAVPDAARNAEFQGRLRGFVDYAVRMGAEAKTAGEKAGWAAAAQHLARYRADMDGAVTLPVGEGFERSLRLPDRTAPVELLHLGRANTDGDAVVWLPRQRILVAGDIVVAPVPFGYGGYPAEWREVLAKLRRYRFRILVPGHGPPQRDRAYLDRLDRALAQVQAQVAPLAAAGLTLAEVQAKVSAQDHATTFVGDDPWLRRWFDQYWLQPITASAYRQARGQPIVQGLTQE